MAKTQWKRLLSVLLCLGLLVTSLGITGWAAAAKNVFPDDVFASNDKFNQYFTNNRLYSVEKNGDDNILRNTGISLSKKSFSGDYTVVVDGSMLLGAPVLELPILIGTQSDAQFNQIFFMNPGAAGVGAISYARFNGTFENVGEVSTGQPIESNKWYRFMIKVSGTKAEVFVDGKSVTTFENPAGFDGKIGFRSDAETLWRNLAVYETTTDLPKEATGAAENVDSDKPIIEESTAANMAGPVRNMIGADPFASKEKVDSIFAAGTQYELSKDGADDCISVNGILLTKEEFSGEYTITVKGKVPTGAWPELAVVIADSPSNFQQFYFYDAAGVANFGYTIFNGTTFLGQGSTGLKEAFGFDRWYEIRLEVAGKQMTAYLDGVKVATFSNSLGFKGKVGIRSNIDIKYKDMTIYNAVGEMIFFGDEGASTKLPEHLVPMIPSDIQLVTDWTETITYKAKDSAGNVYAEGSLTPVDGTYTLSLLATGKLGTHTIEFTRANGKSASVEVELQTRTSVQTNDPQFEAFFESLKSTILAEIRTIVYNGKTYFQNKEWLRDHIHILKASRYWDETTTDPLDFWMEFQFEEGYYPEIIVGNGDGHLTFVGDNCKVPLDAGRSLMRIEIEADIEHMMTQAVYQSWRANGNDEWLASVLPSLEKALTYNTTHPKVWNEELGLSYRAVAADSNDWAYGQVGGDTNRKIEEDTPMAVFYGDNTGLYQAFNYMSEMYAHLGNTERSEYWAAQAVSIRKNLMDVAWNGSFFEHMVHTDPTVDEAPSEWKADFESDKYRLTFSDAYTLNRGFLTQEEADRVIDTFKTLRDNPPAAAGASGNMFAEWVSMYPAYNYRPAILYGAGSYWNGAIMPSTAGELLRGAYIYGDPDYGTDIINRLMTLYERDGELCFMYNQDGSIYDKRADNDTSGRPLGGGGPAGWGTAAVYDGIVAGLIGAIDEGDQFQKVLFRPAWTSTEYTTANACVSYGESDNYFAYSMSHDAANNKIVYNITGDSTDINAEILVPYNTVPTSVTINGAQVDFTVSSKRDSKYATLTIKRTDLYNIDVVEVTYAPVLADNVADILYDGTIAMQIDNPVAYRYSKTQVDVNNDAVAPVIINDRTLVPVRFISENCGADVAWDDATKTVTIKKGGHEIKLFIGDSILVYDGEISDLDTAATIINDRTFIPLRAIVEALGESVYWDNDSRLILIGNASVTNTTTADAAQIASVLVK